METEYEKAQTVLDMFCRVAEKATGDYWEVRKMEDGDLAVVQTFKSAKAVMEDPKITGAEKKSMVTGVLFCMTSGGPGGSGGELGNGVFGRASRLHGVAHASAFPERVCFGRGNDCQARSMQLNRI